ncbi:uncharacterized protein WM277_018917 [Molossus nigricans]
MLSLMLRKGVLHKLPSRRGEAPPCVLLFPQRDLRRLCSCHCDHIPLPPGPRDIGASPRERERGAFSAQLLSRSETTSKPSSPRNETAGLRALAEALLSSGGSLPSVPECSPGDPPACHLCRPGASTARTPILRGA